MDHSLYLAHDDVFMRVGPKTVTVFMDTLPYSLALSTLPIVWEFWHGTTWERFAPQPTPSVQGQQGQVILENPPEPACQWPTGLLGYVHGWAQS